VVRVQLSNFSFDVPDDWCDITPEDDESYPFTIAREGGVGAIQFSFALWVGGKKPAIGAEKLHEMFARFCETQALPIECRSFNSAAGSAIGGSCITPEALSGAWYVSDGVNVALITFTSMDAADPESMSELVVAEGVVSSATFHPS
jgi:hypothetical protein